MQLAHKIELKPNNKQRTYFAKASGVARHAWNFGLAEWKDQYSQGGRPSGMELKRLYNDRKKSLFPWTSEVTKYAAQQPFLDLQEAYLRFFKKQAAYPRFKKKGRCLDSFYVGGDHVKLVGRTIKIPHSTPIRLHESLRFAGKVNSVTISRVADRWFASVQIDTAELPVPCASNQSVGVDLGLNKMAVLSNGLAFESPKPLKNSLRKLAKLQRQTKRKTKGSKNVRKQYAKVAKLHARIANIRKDTLHKLTTHLTLSYKVLGIEDLHVKGMVKNHSLARSISDIGFGEFRRQVEYKAKMRGNTVHIHDQWFASSKQCSRCKEKHPNLTLADRTFQCPSCKLVIDRDLNAAINLDVQYVRPARPKLTPVKMTALRKSVSPICVSSIVETGSQRQGTAKAGLGRSDGAGGVSSLWRMRAR